jgi:hypothetical protein
MENVYQVNSKRVKFLDDTPMETPEQAPAQQQGGGFLSNVKDVGAGLLNAVGQGIAAPAELVNRLSSNQFSEEAQRAKNPNYKLPSERITSGIESITGKGSTEPGNFATSTIQKTASGLPLAALTGGLTGPKLAADLAGSLGMTIAEKFTDNPIALAMTDFLASRGFSKAANWINKSVKPGTALHGATKGQASHVSKNIDELYDQERKIGSKSKAATKPLRDAIENYEYKGEYKVNQVPQFTSAQTTDTTKNMKKLLSKLDTPEKDLSSLYKVKKMANEFLDNQDLTGTQRKFYKGLSATIKKELEGIGQHHPEWAKSWQTADQLFELQHWKSGLGDWVRDAMPSNKWGKLVTNPIAQAGAVILSGLTSGKAAAGLAAIPAGLELGSKAIVKPAKFLKYLSSTPKGRDILMDIMTESAKDSTRGITKAMRSFNKAADEYEYSGEEELDNEPTQVASNRVKFL